MTAAQSVANHLNKEVSYNNAYAGQCLSWVKQFITDTKGIQAPASGDGDAKGYYDDFSSLNVLQPFYSLVTNNPSDVNQMPSQYDIIVWNGDVPGSNGAGHIAVYNSGANGASTFMTWDQNWGNNLKLHAVTHVWKGQGTVLGWMHDKGAVAPTPAVTGTYTPSTPITEPSNATYTIKAGDNYWNLEDSLKLNHGTLQTKNPGVNPYNLQIGQVINI